MQCLDSVGGSALEDEGPNTRRMRFCHPWPQLFSPCWDGIPTSVPENELCYPTALRIFRRQTRLPSGTMLKISLWIPSRQPGEAPDVASQKHILINTWESPCGPGLRGSNVSPASTAMICMAPSPPHYCCPQLKPWLGWQCRPGSSRHSSPTPNDAPPATPDSLQSTPSESRFSPGLRQSPARPWLYGRPL